jgi:predicted transcriptional regulator
MEGEFRDRRFVPNGTKQYEIKQLWDLHHEILRRVALGYQNTEIGQDLGITPQTVSNVRNSQLARGKLALMHQQMDEEALDIATRIQEFAPKALDLLEKIIEGEAGASLSIRAKYAHLHLGRAGYGEVKKITSLNANLSREDIEKIKERARIARDTIEGELA